MFFALWADQLYLGSPICGHYNILFKVKLISPNVWASPWRSLFGGCQTEPTYGLDPETHTTWEGIQLKNNVS